MSGIVDIHSHILPGLDDGSKNLEETMEAVRKAFEQGINTIVVTPHFHPGRYVVDVKKIYDTLELVEKQCKQDGIGIGLVSGQELYYHSELINKLHCGEALTIGKSSFVLVEFSPGVEYHYLIQALHELRYSGYQPILAHFERYSCISRERAKLEEIKSMGVLLQMNYDTLLQKGSLFHKVLWMDYIQEGVVDLLGSDCHGVDYRPIRFDLVLEKLAKQINRERICELLIEKPKQILDESS